MVIDISVSILQCSISVCPQWGSWMSRSTLFTATECTKVIFEISSVEEENSKKVLVILRRPLLHVPDEKPFCKEHVFFSLDSVFLLLPDVKISMKSVCTPTQTKRDKCFSQRSKVPQVNRGALSENNHIPRPRAVTLLCTVTNDQKFNIYISLIPKLIKYTFLFPLLAVTFE